MPTMSFSGVDEIDRVLKGLPLQLTHKIYLLLTLMLPSQLFQLLKQE